MSDLENTYIPHLRAQFQRARPILFTGAGFSMSAKNIQGENLPSGSTLREMIWPLCFPGDPFDGETTLTDLFDFAHRRSAQALRELLIQTFSVSNVDLPEWYAHLFSMPWQKAYTLNIDDLEQTVARTFSLSRNPESRSFLHADVAHSGGPGSIEFLHLNGILEDAPDNVTFSPIQYAQRLVSPDPTFRRLAAELVSSPFVFIGSPLEETPLWQSIEARRRKGGRDQREFRPRSYLVTPHLPPAKRALLGEYNVVWLPMTAEEFDTEVLSKISDAAREGLSFLGGTTQGSSGDLTVPDVTDLAINPDEKNEYFLGYQPIWADIQSGRAVEREHDSAVAQLLQAIWAKADPRGVVVISGISGSGKSTALMKAALRASAAGHVVGWIDPEEDFTPRDIRTYARKQAKPYTLAIDDADIYGSQLSPLLREIMSSAIPAVLMVAVRSGRVDRVINDRAFAADTLHETTVPLLADDDIGRLIDVLLKENRPGRLRGKTRAEQIALFREQAGRELIVAMIQATSGVKFSEKVVEEYLELTTEASRIYGLVAVSTAFRFGLTSQDILIALADETNASLNALEMLIARKLLRRASDGSVFVRHRVIAEVVRDYLQVNGQLASIVQGLAVVAASRSMELQQRGSKARRILRAILNHDFLQRSLGIESTRNLYGSLEEILSWDYHYWLQRGSFEVEVGDLSLAENFLNQSRGLAPDDPYVETEWAYLLFAQANANPTAAGAVPAITQATSILRAQMSQSQRKDGYAFHVMGSQGLSWSRRGILNFREKAKYLREILEDVSNGVGRFPGDRDLGRLHDDLKRELLSSAVDPQSDLFRR